MAMVDCPSCGASLRVPDGMGGRKARCHKCDDIIIIPASAGIGIMPAPPPGLAIPPTFTGAATVLPPPYVPAEGHVPPLPQNYPPARSLLAEQVYPPQGHPPPVGPYPPQSLPRGGHSARAIDRFGPGYPRRRRKKGFPVLLVSLLGGGILLIAGVVATLMILLWGSAGPDREAMAYMPDEMTVLTGVHFDKLLSSSAYKELSKENQLLAEHLKELKNRIGIAHEDISYVLKGDRIEKGNFGKDMSILVVRTNKSYTADQLLDTLKWKGNTQALTAGQHTIHEFKGLGRKALCVVNNNLVLYSFSGEDLQKVLNRNGQPKMSDHMRAAVNNVSFSSTMAFAADLKKLFGDGSQSLPGIGRPADLKFPELLYAAVEANLSTKITVRGTAGFKSATDAENAKKLADGITAFNALGAVADPDQKKALENIKFSTSGSQLIVSVSSLEPKLFKDGGMGSMGGFGIEDLFPDFRSLPEDGVGVPLQGNLVLDVRDRCPDKGFKNHSVQLEPGVTYTIRMRSLSANYEPFLILYDPFGQQKANDGGGGGFGSAKFDFTPGVGGFFQIQCGKRGLKGGNFHLTVEKK
jgi:hypothetical protein